MTKNEHEEKLAELHAKGMRGTLARVFADYIAKFSEPDRAFDALYIEGLFATGTSPRPMRRRDRFRRLLKEFERVLTLPGPIAECGCAGGLSSFLLCSRLRQHDGRFDGSGYEIYDSFQGLSEPQAEDALEPGADELVAKSLRPGMFAFPLEFVQNSLRTFPRISYGPGWIPNAFPKDERRYRFAHIDVDLYAPTKAALKHFWPRIIPGGIVVCDDYNWSGAKRAVEELGAPFAVTPENQAVLVRA